MAVFPIVHVAAGVWILYYTLCLFLNKTYIDINNDYLTVYHQPIHWWKGNKKIATQDITQLYVVEKKSTGKHGTNTPTSFGQSLPITKTGPFCRSTMPPARMSGRSKNTWSNSWALPTNR